MLTQAAVVLAALAAGLVPSGAATAQTLDFGRATCADLMAAPARERPQYEVWLHGYYAGAAQRPAVERARVEAAAGALEALCAVRRDLPLVGADVRAVMLGEAPLAPTAPAPSTAPSAPATGPSPPAVEPPRRGRPTPLR